MVTFNDLINKKVAPANYKTNIIGPDIQCLDRFVVNYNNIWGSISDTHISKGEDGNYYITGQLFRDKSKTTQFVYATNWGAYTFKDSSLGVNNLYNYCINNRKTISHTKVNGDDVLVVKPFTKEEDEYYITSVEQAIPTKEKPKPVISLEFNY